MRGPAHDTVGDAYRIQNVEREKRDVRRLQHIAAGIKDDLGRFRFLDFGERVLAEARKLGIAQLHPRKRHHVARNDTKPFYALPSPLIRRVLRPRQGAARQRQ